MKNSEIVRKRFMDTIKEVLTNNEETVLQIKSNVICMPWVENEEEGYINITFSIPKGSRDGTPFDGYEEANNYTLETEVKARVKAEKERQKQEKIAKTKAQEKDS